MIKTNYIHDNKLHVNFNMVYILVETCLKLYLYRPLASLGDV